MKSNDADKLFIFNGLPAEKKREITEKYSPPVIEYQKGELILSEEKNPHTVGFLLSGECEVRRKRNDSSYVLLNTLYQYDSFGILSVLSSASEYPTEIFARKNTAVLFYSKEDFLSIIESSPQVALNVINFLAEKISFLNKKIATFSGITVEEKLKSYLLEQDEILGSPFRLNCKRCSEFLGVGRASVYRALDSLMNDGIIKIEDKKIYILSR